MNSISNASMVRGADGRLYAIASQGVSEVSETRSHTSRSVRSGNRDGFDTADYEAGRITITPGV